MSTHFVPSVRIAQLIPIEGADFIELAKVMDYQVIVKKGSFQVGDIALYIPEQTIVPEWALEMLGLVGMLSGPNKNILKIKKLRGCISQGLLLPVEKNPSNPLLNRYNISGPFGYITIFPPEMTFENDYAEALGMKKVEVAVPKQLSGNVFNIGQGNTISYDIENFQHWPEVFDGKEVVVAEKLHGTFFCMGYIPNLNHPETFENNYYAGSKGLSSKGLVFKNTPENEGNTYLRMLKKYFPQVKELCSYLGDENKIFIMGEIFGIGVQDLGYGFTEHQFRSFDIRIGCRNTGHWLDDDKLESTLNKFDIQRVPVLYRGVWDYEKIKALRDGNTVVNGVKQIREGIVIRTVEEQDYKINGRTKLNRLQLKWISPEYLLRKEGTEYN